LIVRPFGACALLLGFLVAENTWGQATVASPAPAQPEVTKDALGRTTPRGTVRGFLSAASKPDEETAIRYLNTHLRGEAAAVLSHQLFVVLNRRLRAQLNEISDQPEGSMAVPNEPRKDLIGTVSSDTGDIDILLEHVDRKDGRSLWLFSRQTLDAVPELYAEVNTGPAESGTAKFLFDTRIANIALVHWLGLFIGLPLLYFIGASLNRSLSPLLGRLLRHLRDNPNLPNPGLFPIPVRLLLLALIIRWTLSAITFPLLARQFWLTIATITSIAGCVWLIIRLNGWFEGKARLRFGRRNLTGGLSILRFARSAADALVIFVGLFVFLYHFGINPTTAIAGLGVGGIAIALAAQKTLENVIAGVSLISDKAIRVGDFLKVGDTLGTVSDIGLRSTRIRTLSRTVVNVPNGQIANATLENMSLRDQFWFHHIVRLTYETTVTQLRSVLAGLTNVLLKGDGVDEPSVQVRLLGFGASSLEVEIFLYVFARDYSDFLRIQEELLLEVMDLVEAAGAKLALPSQTTYVTTSSPVRVGLETIHQSLTDEQSARSKSKRTLSKPLADRTAEAQ